MIGNEGTEAYIFIAASVVWDGVTNASPGRCGGWQAARPWQRHGS